MENKEIVVRLRAGGERIRLDPSRPSRTLKNILYEQSVPPWQRQWLPLIYIDEQLAWAGDVGVDCAYLSGAEEEGFVVRWNRGV